MTTTSRAIAVMALCLVPCYQAGSAPPEAEKSALRLEMMDGSIVTATEFGDVPVSTEYGDLVIPEREVVGLAIGLNAHPELAKRVKTLIARLGSPDGERSKAAEKELCELGPIARARVEAAAESPNDERKAAAARILKAYAKVKGAAAMGDLDCIETGDAELTGRIRRKRFTVTTMYGKLAVRLDQLRTARRTRAPKPLPAAEGEVKLVAKLADGSKLTGVSDWSGLRLKTEYGSVVLRPKVLRRVTVAEDGKLTCELIRGDILRAEIPLRAKISIRTEFGDLSCTFANLRSLDVLPKGMERLTEGLVLHFAFEGRARKIEDLSGKGNHGKGFGDVRTDDGRFDAGCRLDGTGDHVTVPNSESIELRQAVTVAAWMKLDTLKLPGGGGNEHGYIVNKGKDLWWNPTFCLGYVKTRPAWAKHARRLHFNVCREGAPQKGGGCRVIGESILETGRWYHVVGTYDGSEAAVYLDGRLEATKEYEGLLRADEAPIHLGGGSLGDTGFSRNFMPFGTIDEVMIWNRALSAEEVELLHSR